MKEVLELYRSGSANEAREKWFAFVSPQRKAADGSTLKQYVVKLDEEQWALLPEFIAIDLKQRSVGNAGSMLYYIYYDVCFFADIKIKDKFFDLYFQELDKLEAGHNFNKYWLPNFSEAEVLTESYWDAYQAKYKGSQARSIFLGQQQFSQLDDDDEFLRQVSARNQQSRKELEELLEEHNKKLKELGVDLDKLDVSVVSKTVNQLICKIKAEKKAELKAVQQREKFTLAASVALQQVGVWSMAFMADDYWPALANMLSDVVLYDIGSLDEKSTKCGLLQFKVMATSAALIAQVLSGVNFEAIHWQQLALFSALSLSAVGAYHSKNINFNTNIEIS